MVPLWYKVTDMTLKEVLLPEGFGPFTIRVIKGKGKGKVSSDTCGFCMQEFTGKTAQESVDKLKEHRAICPKRTQQQGVK